MQHAVVIIHASIRDECQIFTLQHISDQLYNTVDADLHCSPATVVLTVPSGSFSPCILAPVGVLTSYTSILSYATHETHADILYWTGLSGKAAYICVPKTNRMQVSALLSSVTREHESGSKEHMFSVLLMPVL